MAHKPAALVQPIILGKVAREFLKVLHSHEPTEGCEDQWNRYVAAVEAEEAAHARYDAIFNQVEKEGGTSSSPSYDAFITLGIEYSRTARTAFGSLDAYIYAQKHVGDKTAALESEIRATIIDSLEDKLDELCFSVNSGLLGSKVAQAIRSDVTEFDMGDPPACQDC